VGRAPPPPLPPYNQCPPPSTPSAAMDPEARRRAKLSRDTGTNLTAGDCESVLGATVECEGGEQVSLHSDPGRFYACLGGAIADEELPLVLANPLKVAWWCYREAAEVHANPLGMCRLAKCLYSGVGVTEDPAQAVVWFEKAADLGDAASKGALGTFVVDGDARAGVTKDAVRGFALLREAVELGFSPALYLVQSAT